jgi:hypothetical protein
VNYPLRERLADRWRGPGRTICIDAAKIKRRQTGAIRELRIVGLLSRAGPPPPGVQRGIVEIKELPPDFLDFALARLQVIESYPHPEVGSQDDRHGPDFIRHTMHV